MNKRLCKKGNTRWDLERLVLERKAESSIFKTMRVVKSRKKKDNKKIWRRRSRT